MKRKIISAALTIAIVLNCVFGFIGTAEVKATSITQSQAIAWVQSKIGQAIDYDGVYGAQCVDLIKAYYNYLGVSPVTGNGADYASNSLPSGWSRVQGGTPQKGDILVYSGSSSNPFGHVAIYESDNCTYHQNFDGYQSVQKVTYVRYNGIADSYWGYIRPNFASQSNDKTNPVISGKYITEITNSSFRVCVDASDNEGIKVVRIATWTKSDMGDLIWHDAWYNGEGTYFVNINRSDYASSNYYCNHIYVYDYADNTEITSIDMDYSAPTIEAKYISEVTNKSFRVCVVPKSNMGIKKVSIATWTKSDMGDLIWHDANYNGDGTYFVNINRDDYASSNYYCNHIYVYDYIDNTAVASLDMDYTTPTSSPKPTPSPSPIPFYPMDPTPTPTVKPSTPTPTVQPNPTETPDITDPTPTPVPVVEPTVDPTTEPPSDTNPDLSQPTNPPSDTPGNNTDNNSGKTNVQPTNTNPSNLVPVPSTSSGQDGQSGGNMTASQKAIKLSKLKVKRNTKKITGNISVKGAKIKIMIGNKSYKKTIKTKKFSIKLKAALKKKTYVMIEVSKKGFKTLNKVVRVK